ncbi:MAG: dephospho-CoA kinase [Candidatus Omnitrophica bacterium]|nr:dephospho-CoA kinase [Candidatus Omnitrophota bacterium]MDD5081059.1 dephospho-CoA kinase [Candidatus Omnitrophota bacterium]MDD5441473.1 dephospho-CoA kinase [Candidatus Omnitrophota bacterium]
MLVGLTGIVSSGKSTVASMMAKKGAVVYSADQIVESLYLNKKSEVYKRVKKTFPGAFVDGFLLKEKLAHIVFNDENALLQLERIVHPCVIKQIKKISLNKKAVIVFEVPLLFEKKLEDLFDTIVFVYIDREKAIARSVKRFKCSKHELKQRIRRFLPVYERMKKSDYIIKNIRCRRYLSDQVNKVWQKINSKNEK